jgi:hypothetical protein
MTGELEAFRAELKASGEPWQSWGVRLCVAGFVGLVVAQLSGHVVDRLAGVVAIFGAAIGLLAIGWGLLIVAFVRRKRWADTHANLTLPDLPDAP